MKKAVAILFIVSVLLLIWGGTDLYNYATTGRDLLQHYAGKETIQELVNYNLIQGLVKVILGVLAAVCAYLFRSKKR